MKKLLSIILTFAILSVFVCPAYAYDKTLGDTKEFLLKFALYSSAMNLGHSLSIEEADELSYLPDYVLFKTIFNDCEILSLILTRDVKDIKYIKCTWSIDSRGATAYADDFLYLLMEVLCACGMETDSIAEVFSQFGGNGSFDVGDKGEATFDGIKVSYEVTSTFGVSFLIESA